ncbi:reverse transcriptase domain-containing protein [Nonomuraea cypriaca]|uniref:reverse transcriptase domain-containing protein n=1 Tax=Nonomuraea cypriaca TaxID=1187855 RepID=UPI002E2B641F|nr:reverse transcriptase domain-containing protein [Nonomuraea cypriaca]
MGGIRASQGQQGRCRSGQAVHRGLRSRSEEQPLQDLESNVVGNLLPSCGDGGGNPEGWGGGTRVLGLPTVADRVAQTVAALALEPRTESIFHDDSYVYRPRRSALDAVAKCRQRCWKKDWVIGLDVAKFFDSVPWDLMVKAVEANITTDQRWVLLYVKRWLAAPIQQPDGTLVDRHRGTPISGIARPGQPVHALRVRHVAGEREVPTVEFERYADDAVVHCVTERQARQVLAALAERMEQVGLRLHPDKRRSCTAGIRGGEALSSTSRSPSSATPSALARPRIRMGRRSRLFCPRSARRRSRRWVRGLPRESGHALGLSCG